MHNIDSLTILSQEKFFFSITLILKAFNIIFEFKNERY